MAIKISTGLSRRIASSEAALMGLWRGSTSWRAAGERTGEWIRSTGEERRAFAERSFAVINVLSRNLTSPAGENAPGREDMMAIRRDAIRLLRARKHLLRKGEKGLLRKIRIAEVENFSLRI